MDDDITRLMAGAIIGTTTLFAVAVLLNAGGEAVDIIQSTGAASEVDGLEHATRQYIDASTMHEAYKPILLDMMDQCKANGSHVERTACIADIVDIADGIMGQ